MNSKKNSQKSQASAKPKLSKYAEQAAIKPLKPTNRLIHLSNMA